VGGLDESECSSNFKKHEKSVDFIHPKGRKNVKDLPDLWDKFNIWSLKQKEFRFETAKTMATSDQHLVEMLCRAYAKLLCKVASSRGTYSVMDLVQEGYFGLTRAMELYAMDEGVPFGHYAKRHILSRILRKLLDGRTLIRFPIPLWEQIREFEDKSNKNMQEHGTMPNPAKVEIKEQQLGMYSKWKNMDFLSFEQYWTYLSETRFRKCEPSWVHMELLDEQSLKMYYHDLNYTNDELQEQLESICDIVEEESDAFWNSHSTDRCILMADLHDKIQEIMQFISKKEKSVIEKRFDLNQEQECTLEELAKELGCTRERVRQIERKALEKLLVPAKRRHLEEYLYLDSN
jgi:RNA polymerase primary sigma factor